MARQLRIQYPGAVYHITCRGNARQDIYMDNKDREEFLEILKIYGIKIYSYVLLRELLKGLHEKVIQLKIRPH